MSWWCYGGGVVVFVSASPDLLFFRRVGCLGLLVVALFFLTTMDGVAALVWVCFLGMLNVEDCFFFNVVVVVFGLYLIRSCRGRWSSTSVLVVLSSI